MAGPRFSSWSAPAQTRSVSGFFTDPGPPDDTRASAIVPAAHPEVHVERYVGRDRLPDFGGHDRPPLAPESIIDRYAPSVVSAGLAVERTVRGSALGHAPVKNHVDITGNSEGLRVALGSVVQILATGRDDQKR